MAGRKAQAGDEGLAGRAARGDRVALELLLARHAETVLRAAHAVLGSGPEAVDAAQEGLMKVTREIETKWRGGSFKAWVATATHRIALKRLRSLNARSRRERAFAEERAWREAADPAEVAERAEMLSALRDACAALPKTTYTVLALYHLHDCTMDEVAAQTGLSVSACKQRAVRGREELREHLERRGISLAALPALSLLGQGAADWAKRTAPALQETIVEAAMKEVAADAGRAPARAPAPRSLRGIATAAAVFLSLTAAAGWYLLELGDGARAPQMKEAQSGDKGEPKMLGKSTVAKVVLGTALAVMVGSHAEENSAAPKAPEATPEKKEEAKPRETPNEAQEKPAATETSTFKELGYTHKEIEDMLVALPPDTLALLPGDTLLEKANYCEVHAKVHREGLKHDDDCASDSEKRAMVVLRGTYAEKLSDQQLLDSVKVLGIDATTLLVMKESPNGKQDGKEQMLVKRKDGTLEHLEKVKELATEPQDKENTNAAPVTPPAPNDDF